MRLLRVNPTGFFAYGRHDSIELAGQGIVLLQGPVGAGKSSLFDAICEVLYGTSPKRHGASDVTENDVVNRTLGMAFGVVEFEQQGFHYRVAYLRGWDGDSILTGPSAQEEAGGYRGTTVYFEWWDGARWIQKGPDGRDLRMAKMADTWRRVVEVAGVDYAMFCNASYVAQDHALAFIRGKDSDREEILTKLMRLDCYDVAETSAKERASLARRKGDALQATIATLQIQENGIIVGDVAASRAKALDADQHVVRCDAVIAEIDRQIDASKATADASLRMAQQAQDQYGQVVQQIHAKTLEVQNVQAEIAAAKQNARLRGTGIPATTVELDRLQRELSGANATAALENRRLTGMLPGAGRCPSCGSTLDAATLARHKDEQAAIVKVAIDRIGELERAVAAERESIEQARQTAQRAIDAELAGQVQAREAIVQTLMHDALVLESEKAKLASTVQHYRQAAATAAATSLAADRKRTLDERRVWEIELANANAAILLYEQRQADRARIVAAKAEREREFADVSLEAQEWGWLAKHFPRVKQMKFATGSAFLNDQLASHLDVLTGGTTSVTINPFRLKKEAAKKPAASLTADDYIFRFEMVVEEGRKTGVPIRLYSGGERERIVLALICAFWELARSQGGGTNLLLLDEAVSFLDERSIAGVVRLTEKIRETVDSVLLVGHDQALASLLTTDSVWRAVKQDDDTTVIEVTP